MNKHDIFTLIHFNFWANGRLLATCEQITTDEFTRSVTPDPGWGSLRGILVHALDSEYGWRSILQGQEASVILEPSDFTDIATLKARWDIEKEAWLDYVASLSDAGLNVGNSQNPPPWQTIMHVITHGIQHRSEAAFILTGYGYSPSELDFDLFLQECSDSLSK